MDDVVVVQVADGFQDLPDDLGSILFGKLAVFADAVKELAAGSQLGDNVVLVLWRGQTAVGRRRDETRRKRTLDSKQSWNATM